MDQTNNPKHAPIDDVPLETAQLILRAAVRGNSVGLEEAIRVLDCDAHHADHVLRKMAEAGYLEPADVFDGLFFWVLTPNGNRLAHESKRNRIGRDRVQAIISELVIRARTINSDPNRLQRVTLKLFGSALEKRENYGDVDVAIAYLRRQVSDSERARIEMGLKTRQSGSDRQTILGQIMGAERQDTREIKAFLQKGFPQLSLMNDDPMELGIPFRWLIDYDSKADRPIETSRTIIRPNTPSSFDEKPRKTIPSVTLLKAGHRAISSATKVSIDNIHIGLEDAAALEEAMWSPKVTRTGEFIPNDIRSDKRIKFAGFQHLCPVWKNDVGGVAMLREALEWCSENKVWVRDLLPRVSILRSDRTHIIRLGIGREQIYFKVGPVSQTGSLLPRNRTRVSKIDLAGAYAVGRALSKIYSEARCARMPWFCAEIYVPELEADSLPDFPRLLKASKFHKHAFNGLWEGKLL